MRIINAFHSRLSLRRGRIRFSPNISWIFVVPVGLWIIRAYYLPILGVGLTRAELWITGLLIVLSVAISLMAHAFGHIYAARALTPELPAELNLSLLGDAAQGWPDPVSPREEALLALAGPVVNLALGGLAYLVWDAQLSPVLNTVTLFAFGFNLWLFAVNLTPAFPFDGGRLLKAVVWELGGTALRAARLGARLGWIIAGALTIWAAYLVLQHARFSWATGAGTMAFVLLVVSGLSVISPPGEAEDPALTAPTGGSRPLDLLAAGLLVTIQAAVALSLVLTNDGLEAPGAALSVEPMIRISPEQVYPHRGTFILTSVLVQTPITAGEWLVGKVSPVVKIVPPEIIVPEDTTPQEQARQGFEMLDESESTAIVVGLLLAGFNADLVGKGIEVIDIQPESHAVGILQPGDVITEVNGATVLTPPELVDQIRAQEGESSVRLRLQRLGQQYDVDVTLIPPAQPSDSPRLGIVIQPAGFDLSLPFPVEIEAQKIVGGPSAGLMFALTVYNLVTPEDVTGGRRIAGTGTIALDGTVGPIGGVEQKVAAAEAAGAAYFLCPADNYADAVAVARGIEVVRIETVDQALAFLRGLSSD